MRKLLQSWLLLLALAFPSLFAFAEADPDGERSVAWHQKLAGQFDGGRRLGVFVAIDQYRPPLSPVPSTPGAKLVAETLARCGGFDAADLKTVFDEEANKLNIMGALTEILKGAGTADTVVVMFVGHGFVEDGQSILCPFDYDGTSPKLTGLRTDEIRTMLNDCKAAQKVFILESCHSGGAKGVNTADPSSQELADLRRSQRPHHLRLQQAQPNLARRQGRSRPLLPGIRPRTRRGRRLRPERNRR